jgi:predicted O-methyltransferase YrrM
MALTADALISSPPDLHGVSHTGEVHAWALGDKALRSLSQLLEPGLRTLETGAGVSTVLFALKQTHHTCVVPAPDQVARIRAFCEANDISADSVNFVEDTSEATLPGLAPDPLDLVLIDGSHSFPSVFIDWYYTASRLKAGGWLFIDDTQLWTGRVLRDFLHRERDWELVEDVENTVIFRKQSDAVGVRNWIYQPYVVAHSLLTRRQRVLHLVAERDWQTLRRKFGRRLKRPVMDR